MVKPFSFCRYDMNQISGSMYNVFPFYVDVIALSMQVKWNPVIFENMV